ncbi:MAG: CopG family ribbon-helix-helix protein [Candidatus Asgardarchaeia archaeon]
MKVKNISITIDKDVLELLDIIIKRKGIKSRSDAFRIAINEFIKSELGFSTREELREYLKKKLNKTPIDSEALFKELREEEDND